MKVLFIAYEFPPLNAGGSHRPFKFVKHLHRWGIVPVVITAAPEAHRGLRMDARTDVLDPATATIIRTPVDEAGMLDRLYETYYFNAVDPIAARWKEHLMNAVDQAMRDHRIEAVVISIPPFSTGDLGVAIARNHGLPLIVDLRDAWSLWLITPYVSYLHYRWRLRRERRVLTAADAVSVTSAQTIADLKALHPMIPGERFHLITNAFDQPVPDIPSVIHVRKATPDAPLRIGYVGSFYYTPYQRDLMFKPWWRKRPHQFLQYAPRLEDWRYRSPYFFFTALVRLRTVRPDLFALVRVEFIGDRPPWLLDMISSFGLGEAVQLRGRLDHAESLLFQQKQDLLLITSSKVVGGKDYSIAGKTFEYIAQCKPILGSLTNSAQFDLLQRTGLCIQCPPDEVDRSLDTLIQLLEGKITLRPDPTFIRTLHIDHTTAHLAQLITDTVHKTRGRKSARA